MYSQRDEEPYIIGHFKDRIGRFLDIGAADGKTFSNTRKLAEMGWSGVLVEPNPQQFVSLMENVGDNQKMTLVNTALGPSDGLTKFHLSGLVSTLSDRHREAWSKETTYKPIYTHVTSVINFFVRFPGPYDFINLDVEGMNAAILRQNPEAFLQAEMVCIEFEDNIEEIRTVFRGWRQLHRTDENLIFVRNK